MHAVVKFLIVVCSFVVYLAIGAAIFKAIERTAEKDRAERANKVKNEVLSNLTSRLNISDSQLAGIESLLYKYYEAEADYQAAIQENWLYGPAFFFCITVVTTIGYGNISPSTAAGQGFCIVYALMGIPFTAYMLSMIGGYYGNVYKKLEDKFSSRMKDKSHSERRRKIVQYVFIGVVCVCCFVLFFIIPAVIFTAIESWNYRESIYYAFITLSTIGFGDYVAGQDLQNVSHRAIYKVAVGFWIILGLSFLALVIARMTGVVETVIEEKKSEDEGEEESVKSGESVQLKQKETET